MEDIYCRGEKGTGNALFRALESELSEFYRIEDLSLRLSIAQIAKLAKKKYADDFAICTCWVPVITAYTLTWTLVGNS